MGRPERTGGPARASACLPPIFRDMDPATNNSAKAAYEAFAQVYDEFNAAYQAASWTGKLAEKAETLGLPGRRLLDVGCGTGKSFLAMLDRGWQVAGCDISPAMLAIAHRKARGKGVPLVAADARRLPVLGIFDLAWAINDTLNYMLDAKELKAALVGMRSNLGPDGLILFDLNTLLTFRTTFASKEKRGDVVWNGQASVDVAPGSTCEAQIEISGASHRHQQRHFPEGEVLATLTQVGFNCLEIWGEREGDLMQPLDEERHTKAVYMGRVAG